MDPLGEAIRRSLAQAQRGNATRKPTPQDSLIAKAIDAQQFVEDVQAAMAAGAGGPRTEQRVVVVGLLAYAMNLAWSICYLLRTEPMRTHIVAFTLWRTLLETWLRAAFFGMEASEDEITAFRAGKLPVRAWPSNEESRAKISPRLIAILIANKVCPSEPKLVEDLAKELGQWHGLVHGGGEVVNLFDGGDTLQSQVTPSDVSVKLQRLVVLIYLCGIVGLNLAVDEGRRDEVEMIAKEILQKLQAFQAKWPHPEMADSC